MSQDHYLGTSVHGLNSEMLKWEIKLAGLIEEELFLAQEMNRAGLFFLQLACEFEWAWQNPRKSRRLRHVANKTSKEKGIDFCFRVLSAMLNVGPWNRLPLTIRWLKQEYKMEFDVEHLPPMHMPIVYGPLNKRKPKKGNNGGSVEVEEAYNTSYRCVECSKKIKDVHDCVSCITGNCAMKAHLICLAKRFLQNNGEDSFLIPVEGDCPTCSHTFLWRDLMKHQNQTEQALDSNSDSPHWAEELNRYRET